MLRLNYIYLSRVVQNVIDHKPKTHYFIAVDDSKNTFGDMVKVISQPSLNVVIIGLFF